MSKLLQNVEYSNVDLSADVYLWVVKDSETNKVVNYGFSTNVGGAKNSARAGMYRKTSYVELHKVKNIKTQKLSERTYQQLEENGWKGLN